MHRNTFLRSPQVLGADFSLRARPGLFFAGQMTGVEGYMESAASGLLAGRNKGRLLFLRFLLPLSAGRKACAECGERRGRSYH